MQWRCFFRKRNMMFNNFPTKKNDKCEFDLKIEKTENWFDSPIFCIFVVVFSCRYFISFRTKRFGADRTFAIFITENKWNVISMLKKSFIWKYQKWKQLFDLPIVVIFVIISLVCTSSEHKFTLGSVLMEMLLLFELKRYRILVEDEVKKSS